MRLEQPTHLINGEQPYSSHPYTFTLTQEVAGGQVDASWLVWCEYTAVAHGKPHSNDTTQMNAISLFPSLPFSSLLFSVWSASEQRLQS